MDATASHQPPIMFIHGAWLSARSWENFAEFFEARGYDVSAPGVAAQAKATSRSFARRPTRSRASV